jgi:hypothetical protein
MSYQDKMEKLKSYSIKNKLLSENLTNWQLLFLETTQILRNGLIEASKWHNFVYLEENEPFEYLPSDCYNDIIRDIISLWYPFYFDLYKEVQEKIDNNFQTILL